MDRFVGRLIVGAILAGAVALQTLPALAANIFEQGIWMSGPRYDGVVPGCDAALGTIASRFATKERRFWNSDLQVVDFENVKQTAYRPWRSEGIPRRFCSATATISDGHKRTVYFSIGEDTGFTGVTWGVDWCVVGYDRNWAYNPSCKMARP